MQHVCEFFVSFFSFFRFFAFSSCPTAGCPGSPPPVPSGHPKAFGPLDSRSREGDATRNPQRMTGARSASNPNPIPFLFRSSWTPLPFTLLENLILRFLRSLRFLDSRILGFSDHSTLFAPSSCDTPWPPTLGFHPTPCVPPGRLGDDPLAASSGQVVVGTENK